MHGCKLFVGYGHHARMRPPAGGGKPPRVGAEVVNPPRRRSARQMVRYGISSRISTRHKSISFKRSPRLAKAFAIAAQLESGQAPESPIMVQSLKRSGLRSDRSHADCPYVLPF